MTAFAHNPQGQDAVDGKTIVWDHIIEVAVDRKKSAGESGADLAKCIAEARTEIGEVEWNSFLCAILTELLSTTGVKPG